MAAAVLAVALVAPGSASALSFTATGSAEQIYVTGLSPYARMTLISPGGSKL